MPYGAQFSAAGSLIEQEVLTADASTIDFTNIPQNYTHLQIIGLLKGTTAAVTVTALARFNGDSGSNYDVSFLYTAGTSPAASNGVAQTALSITDAPAASGVANRFGIIFITIPFYTNTVTHKSALISGTGPYGTSSGQNYIESISGIWRSTNAITSISLLPNSGNWLAGSRSSLYGIF